MKKIIKSGEVMKLKDLISYEDGSITNIDVVSNDTMKFVLMAFDEGTGLTPHRAPGNAIIFALEGKAVIDYEGKDYTISAGENFRFDKDGTSSGVGVKLASLFFQIPCPCFLSTGMVYIFTKSGITMINHTSGSATITPV